ncbi:hypothetical protein CEXT_112621 [Caerostris extrusa]|uniref:CRAL/TRIO N-terminal domain-containing protein n=1 Tax=Caerostris extrusa TaxID=172846 RepID=A0AAV4NSV4_CAEEX|nr:hypothetical protein CEXT_112621 [Caerostris extrusa]
MGMKPPLSAEDLRVAKEELNETPETRNACLTQLKEMLSNEWPNEHLKQESHLDPTEILSALLKFPQSNITKFLTVANQVTLISLISHTKDKFSTVSQQNKEFTSRTDDDFLLRFLRCRKFDCKKALKMLREHYKFRKLHPDRWDVDKISYEDFIAAGNLMGEYALDNNPVTQVNGFIAIWDYKGFNVRHFKLFCSLRNTLMLVNLLQIKILSSIEQLHEHLDQSILPEEYGGTLEIPDTKEIAQRIMDKEKNYRI